MKHALPLVLSVLAALMALLAIPAVALADDGKEVSLSFEPKANSVVVWAYRPNRVVIPLYSAFPEGDIGMSQVFVGGRGDPDTVAITVIRMPNGDHYFLFEDVEFVRTGDQRGPMKLTLEVTVPTPATPVAAKPADPVKSIPPTIAFELSRSSGTVTGAQCMDIVIASDIDIPRHTMVYEIVSESGKIHQESNLGVSGESGMGCSWSIRYPHEVKVVYAQVFLESRERVVYRCDREESEYSDGHFPCAIREVDEPLPDMAKVAKEDGLFFLYYGNRESRGFRSGKIEIKSTVDIPRGGLFLRGRNASDTWGFEIWPDYLPRIEAGVFETIEIYNWDGGSPNIFLGWAVSEDKKMRYLYCDKNYEDVTVCGSWAKPTH